MALRQSAAFTQELKYFDAGVFGTAIAASTTMAGLENDPDTANMLGAIAQGDGANNREGRQTLIKSVFVNGHVLIPIRSDQTDMPVGQTFFIALILDTQTNGAQFNSEDVYVNTGSDAQLAVHPMRELENTKRFRVVDSVTLVTPQLSAFNDGAATASVSGVHIPFKLSWSGNLKQHWTSGTGAVTACSDNSFHVLAACTTTAGTPVIYYQSRVRFLG